MISNFFFLSLLIFLFLKLYFGAKMCFILVIKKLKLYAEHAQLRKEFWYYGKFIFILPVCVESLGFAVCSRNPSSSDGKASVCNAEDLGLISGSGRSPGEGNGNLLQYPCWKIPWTDKPGRLQFMGSQKVRHDWVTKHKHTHSNL